MKKLLVVLFVILLSGCAAGPYGPRGGAVVGGAALGGGGGYLLGRGIGQAVAGSNGATIGGFIGSGLGLLTGALVGYGTEQQAYQQAAVAAIAPRAMTNCRLVYDSSGRQQWDCTASGTWPQTFGAAPVAPLPPAPPAPSFFPPAQFVPSGIRSY